MRLSGFGIEADHFSLVAKKVDLFFVFDRARNEDAKVLGIPDSMSFCDVAFSAEANCVDLSLLPVIPTDWN